MSKLYVQFVKILCGHNLSKNSENFRKILKEVYKTLKNIEKNENENLN